MSSLSPQATPIAKRSPPPKADTGAERATPREARITGEAGTSPDEGGGQPWLLQLLFMPCTPQPKLLAFTSLGPPEPLDLKAALNTA